MANTLIRFTLPCDLLMVYVMIFVKLFICIAHPLCILPDLSPYCRRRCSTRASDGTSAGRIRTWVPSMCHADRCRCRFHPDQTRTASLRRLRWWMIVVGGAWRTTSPRYAITGGHEDSASGAGKNGLVTIAARNRSRSMFCKRLGNFVTMKTLSVGIQLLTLVLKRNVVLPSPLLLPKVFKLLAQFNSRGSSKASLY